MKKLIKSTLIVLTSLAMALTVVSPAFAINSAPVAENLDIMTYQNTSVGARLTASDPEGTELRFEITTPPVKGELRLSERGMFIYTPYENKRGRDYFGYKVTDVEGNMSQEATVIIKIEKQKKASEETALLY